MNECPKGFSRGNCPECTCVDGVLKATKKDKRNWKDRYDKYEDRMRLRKVEEMQ